VYKVKIFASKTYIPYKYHSHILIHAVSKIMNLSNSKINDLLCALIRNSGFAEIQMLQIFYKGDKMFNWFISRLFPQTKR